MSIQKITLPKKTKSSGAISEHHRTEIISKLLLRGFPRNAFTIDRSLASIIKEDVPNYASRKIAEWIKELLNAENPQRPWLYLYGDVGGYKTALAAHIALKLVIRRTPFRLARNFDVFYYNSASLFDYLNFGFKEQGKFHWERIKRASLLVIDDFGTEAENLNSFTRIYELLNYRYENNPLITFFTSNYDIETFSNKMEAYAVKQRNRTQIDEIDDFKVVTLRMVRRIMNKSVILEI